MTIFAEGAAASTFLAELPTNFSTSFPTAAAPYSLHGAGGQPPSDRTASHQPQPEHVRHLIFGTPQSVQATIKLLHKLGYAEPNDWSRPISTDRAGEVMATLAKRVNAS
ncbi:MAG: hypothetical protein WBD47_07835 [Phormidesmis sp.]